MKVVALISGGKDSCYNMMQCVAMGHQIVALANLQPTLQGEADSYMYQTVGSEAIEMYSEAMQLPLFRRKIQGYSKSTGMCYNEDSEDEVEDLYLLLKNMKDEIDFEAVSCGAILSDYQRIRVENVCARLGLSSLSYLWRRGQEELLQEMIDNQVVAILMKTAALGLLPKLHLGKTLKEMQDHLLMLNSKYGSHACGEGGEYETFTLDCPLFKKRIVIDESEIVNHSDDCIAPVAYLHLKVLHLEEKLHSSSDIDKLNAKIMHMAIDKKFDYLVYKANPADNTKSVVKDWVYERKNKAINANRPSVGKRGNYVCISNLVGTCNADASDADIKLCTKNTLTKLIDLLKLHGNGASDIAYIHLYVSDMSYFSVINSVYKTFFTINPPARVCVALYFDKSELENTILLQIDCISHCNDEKPPRKVMHVQGISHWAPANIGPYSQCVLCDDLYFVAGQIGLVPGTMQLVGGGVQSEAFLSIQHVEKILSAMDSTLGLSDIVQCVCYITDDEYISVANFVWCQTVQGDEEWQCKIVYVTVPSLPRQAAIEWQVVATKSTCNDVDNELYTDRNKKKHVRSRSFFAVQTDSSDPFEVAQRLFNDLISWIKNANLKLIDVFQVRLLYTNENLTSGDMQDIVERLSDCFREVQSVSCIPVQSIYNQSSRTSMALVVLIANNSHHSQ